MTEFTVHKGEEIKYWRGKSDRKGIERERDKEREIERCEGSKRKIHGL